MIAEFRLPDLGEGLTEAEVVQWLVGPGDPVVLNQTLAEVETAKAVVELPSPYAGTVSELHAAAGETVAVGAPLIAFDVEGADEGGSERTDAPPVAVPAEPAPTPDGMAPAAPAVLDGTALNEDEPQPNLVGYGAAASAAGRPARRARRRSGSGGAAETAVLEAAVRDAAPHDARPTATVDVDVERPRSTPPVRAHAKRLGVDLTLVAATVGERRITREDVDAYAERVGLSTRVSDAAPPATSALPDERDRRETRVPVRGVRKHTAAAMVQSAFSAPHVTVFHTVDVTATAELLESLRADPSLREHRIGPLAVVAKAVCLALAATPELNSRWDDAAGEIVRFGYIDLGIAAATDRGLVVPKIREAQALTLVELADRIRSLAQTARDGRSTPADLAGGTFSISNIGVFGVDAGTPILPPGQAGILAVGAIRRQPWEHRGEIALRDLMTLSLSFDHRIVDGAEGAGFLRAVAGVLEQPGRAMLLS